MPLVKVECVQGRDDATLISMRDVLLDTVVNALQLPEDDRNIRINEYPPHLFTMKAPYTMIIEISLFTGRTKETKKKLFHAIVDKLEKAQLAKKEEVFILLCEQPSENWGIRGGIPANEVQLGFKVNV